jgi:hypothetical protein
MNATCSELVADGIRKAENIRANERIVRIAKILADAIRKILDCLGLPSRSPPVAPAVSDITARMDSF